MDTPALIGILDELDRPQLIDGILKLGHTLAIAGHVKPELRRSKVREGVEDMVRQGKIRVFVGSTAAEIRRIREGFPGLGLGECDTLLLYGRVCAQGRSYCIRKACEIGGQEARHTVHGPARTARPAQGEGDYRQAGGRRDRRRAEARRLLDACELCHMTRRRAPARE